MTLLLRSSLVSTLALTSLLLASACGGSGGGDGGGGGGNGPDCSPMHDDAPLESEVTFRIKNQRTEAVYMWLGGCPINAWSVDGRDLFSPSPPTCSGLFEGEPGLPTCAGTLTKIDPGGEKTLAWDGRGIESAAVVAGCSKATGDTSTTCDRFTRFADGAHSLSVDAFLAEDFTMPLPKTVVSFNLPAQTVDVNIVP